MRNAWHRGDRRRVLLARVLKTRVALSWVMEMIFSKDLEQMLTLRDVELISRMGTVAAQRRRQLKCVRD
jgi:hypothetical protein